MGYITVGGFDPSLRNCGMAKGSLDIVSGDFEPLSCHLATTTKSNDKSRFKRVDDIFRAKHLISETLAYFSDCDLVFVEVPIGSQSSSGAISYAISCTLVAAISEVLKKPYVVVDPLDLKRVATGNKNATKAQMIEWARSEFPEINIPKAAARAEHIADAFGAIYAGVLTDEFNLIKVGLTK